MAFQRKVTSSLPASTEIVPETSAMIPDRGDRKQSELDFYVNHGDVFGIKLMRDGGNFKEHKGRFLEHLQEQAEGEVLYPEDTELSYC